MISIDSLRADHLDSYGYARETAPNLARLAREGVLFERMVADSSWTLPTHLSLLTGLSSWAHGALVDTRRLDEGVETLAEVLRDRGYRTEGFASGPYLHPIFGFADGFEKYELLGRTVYDESGFTLDRLRQEEALRMELELREIDARRTRTSVDLARRVEEALARAGASPFFIFVHMFDVHYDFDPPEAYWRRFNPEYRGRLESTAFVTDPAVRPGMDPQELEQVVALYDGEIRWTDESVGRMLDLLDLYGVGDRTLVVVVADHGEEFFDHGGKGHRHTLYDEQLLVPFVMRLPGVLPADRRVGMQVRMIDVAPTALDLMGLTGLEQGGGRSLVPFVLGGAEEVDLPALSYLVVGKMLQRTYRTGATKLRVEMPVEMAGRTGYRGRVELFDLERDPGEAHPIEQGEALERTHAAFLAAFAEEERRRARVGAAAGPEITLPAAMQRALEQLGYAENDEAENDEAESNAAESDAAEGDAQ